VLKEGARLVTGFSRDKAKILPVGHLAHSYPVHLFLRTHDGAIEIIF